jgi:hypothetical protein
MVVKFCLVLRVYDFILYTLFFKIRLLGGKGFGRKYWEMYSDTSQVKSDSGYSDGGFRTLHSFIEQ